MAPRSCGPLFSHAVCCVNIDYRMIPRLGRHFLHLAYFNAEIETHDVAKLVAQRLRESLGLGYKGGIGET